jgi:hypothetical protein
MQKWYPTSVMPTPTKGQSDLMEPFYHEVFF